MGRIIRGIDRIAALLVGVVLLAAGLAMIGWRSGVLTDLLPRTPNRLEADWAVPMTRTEWWPWATGAAGVLVFAIGFSWLFRHFRRGIVGRLMLPGSDVRGRLSINADAAAEAAAATLAGAPGVVHADGRIRQDRGQLVAEFDARLQPTADLARVLEAAAVLTDQLGAVLGRDDLRCRVELGVSHRSVTAPARVD